VFFDAILNTMVGQLLELICQEWLIIITVSATDATKQQAVL
jgi:hypothetical protein